MSIDRRTLLLGSAAGIAALAAKAGEVRINNDFAVESDGTFKLENDATVWRDELQPLIGQRLDSRSTNVSYDFDEFTVYFEPDADMNDDVVMNIQMNHDWDGITPVEPHLHWFQNQNATPNWLIAYRWHQNGQPKVEDWTYQGVDHNAFTYSSGEILQISAFGSISPPATPTDVSSILQLKLMRDTGADSTVYSSADSYSGNAHALSLDLHIKIDTMGSREEYVK